MLILTRNSGQKIICQNGHPDQITITVLEIKGGTVRIGIDAPKTISIDRDEILRRKQGPQFEPLKVEIDRKRKGGAA